MAAETRARQIRVLLVDDDEDDYLLTQDLFSEIDARNLRLDWLATYEEAMEAIQDDRYEVYLIDYRLGPKTGLELLREAIRLGCRRPMILLTGQDERWVDVEATQAGAADYLVKGRIDAHLLERSIRYAIRHFNALEALRQAVHENSLFATAINHLNTGVTITDATLTENPVVFVNPGFCRITGYQPQEVIGRGPDFLFGNDTDRGEIDRLRRAVREGAPATSLLLCYRKDGSPFWNELSLNPIRSEKGELVNFVALQNDVTVRRQAEEMRLAKEAAEQANQAKSDFLAKMSHELRTPLNSVIGFTNYLLKHAQDRLDPQQVSCLERIFDNGRHLLTLINEILDLSKIEMGEVELNLTRFSPALLIQETVREIEGQKSNPTVRLRTEMPSTAADLESDRDKLKQILINLLGNALKFTHEGSVTVRLQTDGDGKPTAASPGATEAPASVWPYATPSAVTWVFGWSSRVEWERVRRFRCCWTADSLARIIHKLSAAAPGSSVLTALATLSLLDVVHDYATGGLERNAFLLRRGFGGQASGRRFRRLATKPRE